MAIAIRTDLAQRYENTIAAAEGAGRARTTIACNRPNCAEYVVFYGPALEEAEARGAIAEAISRAHPQHVACYGLDEPNPREDAQCPPELVQVTDTEWGCSACGFRITNNPDGPAVPEAQRQRRREHFFAEHVRQRH